jgi:hypothetical protein
MSKFPKGSAGAATLAALMLAHPADAQASSAAVPSQGGYIAVTFSTVGTGPGSRFTNGAKCVPPWGKTSHDVPHPPPARRDLVVRSQGHWELIVPSQESVLAARGRGTLSCSTSQSVRFGMIEPGMVPPLSSRKRVWWM